MSWIRWIRRVEAGFGGHVGDNLGREGGWCVWTRRILGFTRVPHVSDASGASCGNRTLRAAAPEDGKRGCVEDRVVDRGDLTLYFEGKMQR